MPGQVFSYFTYNYSNSLFKGRDMSFCLRPHRNQMVSERGIAFLVLHRHWNHVEPHRNHMVSEHGIAVSCVTPPMGPHGTAQEPHGF